MDIENVAPKSGGRMWLADIETLEEDLHARLGRRLEEITDARLQVEPVAIVEVLSAWLADNDLTIVNEDMEIFEI
jgi:hypothetical protein